MFSRKANVTTLGPDQQPARMLNRFLASILHPMIHTGCGLEFGFLGLVAEGLAQATCHSAQAVTMIPPTLFKSVSHPDSGHAIVSRLTALLPSLSLGKSSAQHTHSPTQTKSGVRALTIISRILNDPAFAPSAIGLPLKVESNLSVLDVVSRP
ncbi:hypothetical protein A0H81_07061 [Grifola frondosa]|uniref:Uncharacterized protein n=1 Tax=Grifola frondosa TaxID=5627 RepID=A0A1C7M8X9_GRIFR|nr:hypothetical protein A0H81_07061 [Grifola frondosa]